MMQAIIDILLKIQLRIKKQKKYDSWIEADKATIGANYSNATLNKFRADRFKFNLENGFTKEINNQIKSSINFIDYIRRKNKISCLNILDFGGADGAFLSQIQTFGVKCTGTIVESESLIKELPELLRKKFTFETDVNSNFDLIYTSCALNYVESPYLIIEKFFLLAKYGVVFQRNCFSDMPEFIVQSSLLHSNGWGMIPKGWPNRIVEYPHQTVQPSLILKMATQYGFVLHEVRLNNTGVIGGLKQTHYGIDLFFLNSKYL